VSKKGSQKLDEHKSKLAVIKKKSQNLDQHRLNLIIVEKEIQELEQSQKQDLGMISKGKIRRIAI
jgi:hypothetical protein